MKPIISIIVPIYNVEKYLERCIKSILEQSFTNFELILVNDGSPDKCGVICDIYSKKDSRVKVIHKENGGLSDARNAGLEVSKGMYIGFVDSDDFIHKDMYKILYKVASENDSDIVQCKYKRFFNEKEIIKDENSLIQTKIYSVKESISKLIDNEELNVNSWNKLYKAKLFKKIRFPKGKIHEDEYVTYKLFYESNKITYISKELYYYFQNNEGIMRSTDLVKRFDRIEALQERSKFFNNNNEFYLYEKSNCALFISLTNLYFLIKKDKNIEKKYHSIIKKYIKNIVYKLRENKELSKKNMVFVNLISKNYYFINIYYYFNYILSCEFIRKKYYLRKNVK